MNPMRNIQTCLPVLLALVLVAGRAAEAQTTNAPAQPVNYSTFSKFISDRNIFNPNRIARSPNRVYPPRTPTRAVRHNSFGLTGTLSYDATNSVGCYAFFDGSSSEYSKAVKQNETIAVFKIGAITPDSVTLLRDTNEMVLKVGMQMRDDGQGHWSLSNETISYAKTGGQDSGRNSYGRRRNGSGDVAGEGAPGETENAGAADSQGGPDQMLDSGEQPPDESGAPVESGAGEQTITVPAGVDGDAIRRLIELRAQEQQ